MGKVSARRPMPDAQPERETPLPPRPKRTPRDAEQPLGTGTRQDNTRVPVAAYYKAKCLSNPSNLDLHVISAPVYQGRAVSLPSAAHGSLLAGRWHRSRAGFSRAGL